MPPKTGKAVSVYLDETVYAQLKRITERDSAGTVSELVRIAVSEWLVRQEKGDL